MNNSEGVLAGLGLIGSFLVIVLAVVYILLPLKLWRMADRIKKMTAQSEDQLATLRRIATGIESLKPGQIVTPQEEESIT